jgi:very-short-patch-repair endonuclease
LNNLKHLKEHRRRLRNNPTKAESQLWKALQKKQLEGKKFRRQHSIGNYIVDFYCPSEKLAIELDGSVHDNFINENYDRKRTEFLSELGITVLRFENKMVFRQLDMVLDAIKEKFDDSKSSSEKGSCP